MNGKLSHATKLYLFSFLLLGICLFPEILFFIFDSNYSLWHHIAVLFLSASICIFAFILLRNFKRLAIIIFGFLTLTIGAIAGAVICFYKTKLNVNVYGAIANTNFVEANEFIGGYILIITVLLLLVTGMFILLFKKSYIIEQ